VGPADREARLAPWLLVMQASRSRIPIFITRDPRFISPLSFVKGAVRDGWAGGLCHFPRLLLCWRPDPAYIFLITRNPTPPPPPPPPTPPHNQKHPPPKTPPQRTMLILHTCYRSFFALPLFLLPVKTARGV